jgi:hypothetical protein
MAQKLMILLLLVAPLHLGGNVTAEMLNQEYQILNIEDANKYTITAKSFNSDTITNALYTNIAATSSDSGNGGSSVVGAYQINTGASSANPLVGWGASGWGSGAWGQGISDTETLRIWSQQNFGEDLIFGHRDGAIFYWDASGTLTTRAVLLSSKAGASQMYQQYRILYLCQILAGLSFVLVQMYLVPQQKIPCLFVGLTKKTPQIGLLQLQTKQVA